MRYITLFFKILKTVKTYRLSFGGSVLQINANRIYFFTSFVILLSHSLSQWLLCLTM